jgi:hypothetical protein
MELNHIRPWEIIPGHTVWVREDPHQEVRLVFFGRAGADDEAIIYGRVIDGFDRGMFGRWPVSMDDWLAVRNHPAAVAAAIAEDVEP